MAGVSGVGDGGLDDGMGVATLVSAVPALELCSPIAAGSPADARPGTPELGAGDSAATARAPIDSVRSRATRFRRALVRKWACCTKRSPGLICISSAV